MSLSESPVSEGDTLCVRVNQLGVGTDGLCEGMTNIHGIDPSDAWEMTIRVQGDVEVGKWYLATICGTMVNDPVAEVESEIQAPRTSSDLDTEPDPDPERTVWLVATTHSDCFHASRNCQMVKKREGELVRAQLSSMSDPLPDQISDMRQCEYCF